MVACAAGISVAAIQLLVGQPVVIGSSGSFMQQNSSCAIVDQLKQRLQLVIENADENVAIEVISRLENLTLSKEVLEVTRIGLTVNEIRRRTAQTWPDISRRCRGLIKSWQKLADFQRPLSSCGDSSNGGTPSLISPGLKRGLTPGGGKRITSTDSKCSTSKNGISPSNGSYAPRKATTPQDKALAAVVAMSNVHKSASVGGKLCSISLPPAAAGSATVSRAGSQHVSPDLPAGIDAASFNAAEKRKAQDSLGVQTFVKRSKSAKNLGEEASPPSLRVGATTTTTTSSTTGITANGASTASLNGGGGNGGVSVVAARKDVQSTAELVAQLTGSLPQNMTIDLKVDKRQLQNAESAQLRDRMRTVNSASVTGNGSGIRVVFSTSPQESGSGTTASGSTLGKTKRKYTKRAAKFFRNASAESLVEEGEEFDAGASPAQLDTIKEELSHSQSNLETVLKVNKAASTSSVVGEASADLSAEVAGSSNETPSSLGGGRSNNYWESMTPSVESLRNLLPEHVSPFGDSTKSYVVPFRERQVLMLPYCDIGMPDFLEHDYPDREQFYAPEVRMNVEQSEAEVEKKKMTSNGS